MFGFDWVCLFVGLFGWLVVCLFVCVSNPPTHPAPKENTLLTHLILNIINVSLSTNFDALFCFSHVRIKNKRKIKEKKEKKGNLQAWLTIARETSCMFINNNKFVKFFFYSKYFALWRSPVGNQTPHKSMTIHTHIWSAPWFPLIHSIAHLQRPEIKNLLQTFGEERSLQCRPRQARLDRSHFLLVHARHSELHAHHKNKQRGRRPFGWQGAGRGKGAGEGR